MVVASRTLNSRFPLFVRSLVREPTRWPTPQQPPLPALIIDIAVIILAMMVFHAVTLPLLFVVLLDNY